MMSSIDHAKDSNQNSESCTAESEAPQGASSSWRVLVVEDDMTLAALILSVLRRASIEASSVYNGEDAVKAILEEQPHLVLLDLMLPKINGLEVCRRVRSQYQGKIVMLTARGEDASQLEGFEVGADDYLVKPVKPKLLIARIKAHLRQVESAPPPLKIDLSSRSVEVHGKELKLTTSEFDLLALLASHSGVTLTRQELYHELRGIDYDGLDRSIDLRVSKLRSNLRVMGFEREVIKTVHGRGYHFVPMNDLCVVHDAPQTAAYDPSHGE